MTPDELPPLFAQGWALDKPHGFPAHFTPLLHPEARFSQPMLPEAQGVEAVQAMFRRLFSLLPDLTPTPTRIGIAEDGAFIESRCTATTERRTVRFEVCDRFVLGDGLIIARHSFYDPSPLIAGIARSPSTWRRAVRARSSSGEA